MTNRQLLELVSRGGDDYRLTRFVILRFLGFVYAIAFLVAINQLVPLIGEHGLTPASDFLQRIETHVGSSFDGMVRLPTLFWFGISDHALTIFSWIGLTLSLLALPGHANPILLAVPLDP